jgi:hypothetical protein
MTRMERPAALLPVLAACGVPPGSPAPAGGSAPGSPAPAGGSAPGSPAPTGGGSAPGSPAPTGGGSAPGSPAPDEGSAPGSPPPSTGGPTPINTSYRQFDQDVARLLDRQAAWQAPKRINVDQTARVGLVIGDPSLLKTQIRQLVPGSYPKPAGHVKVGSTIGVRLVADPSDASVTPKDAIDESMGEHTALLWTWFVRATHPNPGLFLIAEIVAKMSDGHALRREVRLTIPVDRTLQYSLYQIFSNWATWAAIVGALSTAVTVIWRKRKKQNGKKPKVQKQPRGSSVTT